MKFYPLLAVAFAAGLPTAAVLAGPFDGVFRSSAKREVRREARRAVDRVVSEALGTDARSVVEELRSGGLRGPQLRDEARKMLIERASSSTGLPLDEFRGLNEEEALARVEQDPSRYLEGLVQGMMADVDVLDQEIGTLPELSGAPAWDALAEEAEDAAVDSIGQAAGAALGNTPEDTASPWSGLSPAEIEERIRTEVYREKRITRFSNRSQRVRADAIVEHRMRELLEEMGR